MPTPTEVLDTLDAAAARDASVPIGGIVRQLGCQSFGAMLALPAALELSPLGGLPGVPSLLALMVALVAWQMLVGRTELWTPSILARRHVSRARLRAATDWLRPAARWGDAHLSRHMHPLIGHRAQRFVAPVILSLCATVPFLEFVPFASSLPMATILLFGLGLMKRDGRLMALGWLAVGLTVWGVSRLWS